MKRLFLYISLFVSVGLVSQSCKKDDEPKARPALHVVINGTEHTFNNVTAAYNPITRNVELVYGTSEFSFDITFVNLQNLAQLAAGDYNFECDVVISLDGMLDGNYLGGFSEQSDKLELNLTKANLSNDKLEIEGTSNDFSVTSLFDGKPITISGVKFIDEVSDPSSTMDYISLTVDGIDRKFYTTEQSHYTDEGDLRLSANIAGDGSAFGWPGTVIMLRGFDYPPTVKTVSGYSQGLEIMYDFWTGETTQCGDFVSYNNGNLGGNDNATLSISTVKTLSDGFELQGTFSGKIGTSSSDFTTASNGTFKITIPKK